MRLQPTRVISGSDHEHCQAGSRAACSRQQQTREALAELHPDTGLATFIYYANVSVRYRCTCAFNKSRFVTLRNSGR